MGLVSGIQAMNAMNKIRSGGSAELSFAQISQLIINLMDAKKNLSKEQYEKLFALYMQMQKYTQKEEMDLTGYSITALTIIREFDKIAPYELYSGADPKETALLMREIRSCGDIFRENEEINEATDYEEDIVPIVHHEWIMYQEANNYGTMVYKFAEKTKSEKLLLRTPNGEEVTTIYFPLALRILQDLKKYGYNYRSADSILSWHFTMIDNFSKFSHEQAEEQIINSFLVKYDWTIYEPKNDHNWHRIFGVEKEHDKIIRQWLKHCTLMQLTAIVCIGNAFESVNIAYVLADVIETYAKEEHDIFFRAFAQYIASNPHSGLNADALYREFQTFKLYYGIHLEENGPTLPVADTGKYDFLFSNDARKDIIPDKEPAVSKEEDIETENIVIPRDYLITDDGEKLYPSMVILNALITEGKEDGFFPLGSTSPLVIDLFKDSAKNSAEVFTAVLSLEDSSIYGALAFCAMAGIGAAYYWYHDRAIIEENRLLSTLSNERGLFEMDEFVLNHIGIGFSSEDGRALTKHMTELTAVAIVNARKFKKYFREELLFLFSARAMYEYGLILEVIRQETIQYHAVQQAILNK